MKRWALRICVFLLLGAIVNVAVAWGCVIRLHAIGGGNPLQKPSREHLAATWARLAPPDWNAEPSRGYQGDDFGLRTNNVDAGLWPHVLPGGQQVSISRYLILEKAAGWPLLSLRLVSRLDNAQAGWRSQGSLRINAQIGRHPYFDVPTRPMWPGFAVNTLFYAGILWLLFAAPFALRRRRRIKRGLCPKCAYPIGNSDVCTECGAAVRNGGEATR